MGAHKQEMATTNLCWGGLTLMLLACVAAVAPMASPEDADLAESLQSTSIEGACNNCVPCTDEEKMNGKTDRTNGDGSKTCVQCADSPDRPFHDQGSCKEAC